MDYELERRVAEHYGINKKKERPDPLEQLRDSPLSDPGFKDWLRRRLSTTTYEVEGLLMWLAEDGQVAMSTSGKGWQEDLLVLFQEKREQEYEEAGSAGVPMAAPKRLNAPPGRLPREDALRLSRPVPKKTGDKSEIVARYVAHRAAERADVSAFRREVLGGRLHGSGEIHSVLSSAAYQSSRGRWTSLISDLGEAYGWEQNEAVGFLVSGEAPAVTPTQAKTTGTGQDPDAPVAIELTVMPWTTAEEVKATYQALQREFLGGDNRPLGERALDLFRFVTSQEANPEDKPSRKELFRRWNAEHEAEEYRYEDLRSFNRDVARVEKIARRCLAGGAGSPRQE